MPAAVARNPPAARPGGIRPLPNGAFGAAHPAARTLHLDPGTKRIRCVISTVDPDRAGDVVVPAGLRNLDEFMHNPVVLWAHNRTQFPPLGVCEWIDVQPRRVVAQTRFAAGVPFADDIFRLYELGVLKGWSVGFVPRRARRLPDPATGQVTGLRVEEWDLLEYSAVPIPENPAALTLAIRKGAVTDPTLRDWLAPFAERPADVLAGLVAAGPAG